MLPTQSDASPGGDSRVAYEIVVNGVVQAVGFRPFVHRVARRRNLAGWVRNESGVVRIHIEGPPANVDGFTSELRSGAPPLARVSSVEAVRVACIAPPDFRIAQSTAASSGGIAISPDMAVCEACLEELDDPSNRRYRYPFITCTDCGPRFTVVEGVPYDRDRTTMRRFEPCDRCALEYGSPADRRFHSQTNACPECGPRLWFEAAAEGGTDASASEAGVTPPSERNDSTALSLAVACLARGDILAVRGLGGFHLAVDACDPAAVTRLRTRKARDAKPFAVMVSNLDAARRIGAVGALEAQRLTSPERPIVLLRRLNDSGLAPGVAPGLDSVGVMLGYTPLHVLLLAGVGRPLVMTSGNQSNEPIAIGNEEATQSLEEIADAFLFHDREIVQRYDDSVEVVVEEQPMLLRRARGVAPLSVPLPVPTPVPLLAVGPHLKNTFTLATGNVAYTSQHIGDLETLETVDHFHQALRGLIALLKIEPRVAVHDSHPAYMSTRVARESGLDLLPVQHHHAHIAAVLAEHGRVEPAIGIAFDGTGFGEDGTVWGGEFLLADLQGFRRVGHLLPAPLPGGDLAAREPWRTALGYASLDKSSLDNLEPQSPVHRRISDEVGAPKLNNVLTQIRRKLNTPLASSMGRLFDAAAATIGLRFENRFEGQAAMELEALAGRHVGPAMALPHRETNGVQILDPLPLLSELGDRAEKGEDPADLAAGFHNAVALATADVVEVLSGKLDIRIAALGGGCFQNVRLLTTLRRELELRGLEVLVPRAYPANDGAISYGQAAIAAARLAAR